MKILVTGRGGAASWTVRGEQIGAALGATVQPKATLAQMRAADVILVVKRVPEDLLAHLQGCGRPWAYDIVDGYPQRNAWSKAQCVRWLRDYLLRLRPDAVIWPNRRMREDFGGTGSVIYHHHRPGIEANPIRERVETVGYEGSERYLDGWREVIEAECRRRGVRFLVNPARLADVDVVLAVRGGVWDGYATRHWKSQVKLANAQASGTPCILPREDGYLETASGGEVWLDDDARGIGAALDILAPQESRIEKSRLLRRSTFTVEQAARQTLDALALCVAKS